MLRQTTLLTTLFLLGLSLSCDTSTAETADTLRPGAEGIRRDCTEVEAKLQRLGIILPEVSAPVANYVNAVQTGNLLFMAGKGPTRPDGTRVTGKLGTDLTVEQGYEAARLVGINQLAVLKQAVGNLDRVKRIVKVTGMVNASPDFKQHPQVINGFSDLMVSVFGERGKHARTAVGMGSLPSNIAVEIEMVVEIE